MAPDPHQARQAQPPGYFERLRTPWWWYLAALGVSALLGLEFAVAIPGRVAWVPFAILVPASLLVVWRLSSGSVSVDGATLRAGARTVPVTEIDQAVDLSPPELRRLVGRHGDPLAYTYIRSWVGPGVQLVLQPGSRVVPQHRPGGQEPAADDLADLRFVEPYWVVSTRHPDRLLAALHAALHAARAAGSRPAAG